MQGISWIKAYGVSLIFHIIVILVVGLFVAGTVTKQEEKQMYVVDLDASNLESAGSGHAGGGGGGNSSLFPEKLSEAQMEQKMAQATQAPTPTVNHPEVPTTTDAVPSQDTSANPAPSAAPAATPSSSGYSSDAGSSGGYGTGSGSGTGSGVGEGSGSGEGGGSGSGYGDGTGDGQGYGEGSGDGQGSGDSGAEGTGTGAFDTEGFWAAVNANKVYPPMAVRRGLTGSVTIRTTIDSSGTITDVSVIESSGQRILDNAAVQAAYSVGSYPNPTGGDYRPKTTVTFNLN